MKDDNWHWRWMPKNGISHSEINSRLEHALETCIQYGGGKHPVLGFPGTTPAKIALEAHVKFAERQPNNLGYHTKEIPSEIGFEGTQILERDFIYGIAEMLGVCDPEKNIDGYI
ncbi:MAG: hypothetical protein Q7R98_03785 [Candidatus Jorgensenbacteria bacterium]|nr:hypothetical protein [Candidatus Jorgensenbacteria bacterium]